MSNVYEVRVKHNNEIYIDWKSLPSKILTSASLPDISDEVLEYFLLTQIEDDPTIYEIRWNRASCSQGHYIPGSKGKVK